MPLAEERLASHATTLPPVVQIPTTFFVFSRCQLCFIDADYVSPFSYSFILMLCGGHWDASFKYLDHLGKNFHRNATPIAVPAECVGNNKIFR